MKHLTRLLVAAMLVVPLVACDDEGPSQPATGALQGTVTVEGMPLSGVTVTLSGPESATTTTGSDGSYSFSGIEAGNYTVTLSGIPSDVTFQQTSVSATVPAGGTATAAFSGSYVRTASIVGTVRADDANVVGLTVTLSGVESRTTTTDNNGAFSFTGLRAGDYTVSIDVPAELEAEFDVTSQNVSLSSGEAREVTFSGVVPNQAQLFIESLSTFAGGHADPDDIEGRVFVNLDIVPGDETVERVAITLNGEEVASQDVSISAPTSGAAAASSNAEVTLSFNSGAFNAETFEVMYPNGQYELGALLETSQGSVVTVSQSQMLNFDNEDLLTVEHIEDTGNTAVTAGERWWGGDDIMFRALALNYSQQVEIDQIGVTCTSTGQTANGGSSLDLGSGAGAEHMADEAPFEYTATYDDNEGAVEDDPASDGHTCSVTSVLDPEGVEIIDSFDPARVIDLEEFRVDMVAPQVDDGGSSVVGIGDPAAVIAANTYLSEGDFGVTNMTELGVGFSSDGLTFDVLVDGDVEVAGAENVEDDVPERVDEYEATVTKIEDKVGNAADIEDVDDSNLFGVDKTAPEIEDALPAEDGVYRLDGSDEDHQVIWDVSDPDLADGNQGTGVDHAGVVVTVTEDDGTETTFTIADAELTENRNADATDGDYALDVSGFADGDLTIEVETPDGGTLTINVANEGDFGFPEFELDLTNPTFDALNPVPTGTTGTDASSITQTIGGEVSDLNFLQATLHVLSDGEVGAAAGTDPHDDADAGDGVADNDGICEFPGTNDELLQVGTAPGRGAGGTRDINRNSVETEDQNFNESFQIFDPTAGGDPDTTIKYCYIIEAEDAAMDNTGASDPNTATLTTEADVTWNTGNP